MTSTPAQHNQIAGEVIQADRKLAADILDELSDLLDHKGLGQVADLIRDGEYDEHDTVITVRRHRLATSTDTAARLAEAEKAFRSIIGIREHSREDAAQNLEDIVDIARAFLAKGQSNGTG